jgi:glycosyltransferase involved in cell wall biosynthesis
MRILLLSIYYPPEVGANSRIVDGLSRELSLAGDEVTVLTDFPHYPEGVILPEYRGKFFLREMRGGIKVIRNWLMITPRKNTLLRIANHLTFALTSIFGGLFSGKQDIIYAYSPPLFLGFTGYVISRIKQIPFVFNVQDIYPEIAVNYGIISNNKIIKILESFERWIYRKASKVAVISPGFKQNLINKNINPNKIAIIPNWVEGELFKPRPKDNPFSRNYGLNNFFVAMYAGNIGHSQGLGTLVEAARLLADQPKLLFVIVGEGVKKQELIQLKESYQLNNILFLPFQPRSQMSDVLAAADVSFVILEPKKSKTTIQSKTYEIMAMERPIVASVDRDGDNWALIEEAKAGIWAEPGNPRKLAEAVLKLETDESLRIDLGKNGRRYILRNNTSSSVCQLYGDLFSKEIFAMQARQLKVKK